MEVEDNALVVLGERVDGPWAALHASWTEWKNLFSLEIFCRTAKLQVDGLARSYGAQRITVYRMGPELGPPEVETTDYPPEDESWRREWLQFAEAIHAADDRPPSAHVACAADARSPSGDLGSALCGWRCVEEAYARQVGG